MMRIGSDRRQPILKEGTVARLFGEETFRQIIAENCPLPVPLGLGCGYARHGDWSPAYHDIDAYTPNAPTPLQRLLQPAFAWFSSLSDLKESVRQAYYRNELRRRHIPMIEGAGFSSLSALINEATVNGKRDSNNWFQKASNTTAAGIAYWTWMFTGYPSAGTIPAASLASTATSATTPGAFGQGNAPASNTKHLVSASATSTVAAGALLVNDMTLIVQPVLATTTAQTITGSPSRYQSNGNNGVLPWLFCGGTLQSQSSPNFTLTYTESTLGTTGHTTGVMAGFTNATAYSTMLSPRGVFMPIAAGDVGVRRLETTTWSVAASQAAAWGMSYPYCWIPLGVANALFGTDLINTQFNLVQVIDGACINFFLEASAASSGLIQGELVLVSGNS